MQVNFTTISDCHMVFDTPNSLSNHQLKFCTGSKYANLDTLTD